mmetsp:Transcript_4558/g.7409  ORF Transcript_4558/g.7409 Transcript_4558/m.7409 type:complete len:317 (-) Transcript_4558:24-974(-)
MEDLLEEIGKELKPPQARETYTTLNKILGNIVQNPSEPKFRSLKKSNKMIAEKLLASAHAVSLLLAIGFDDTGEAFVCPGDADLEQMRSVVDVIAGILVSMEDVEPDVTDAKATAVAVAATTSAVIAVTAKSPAPVSKPSVVEPQGFKRRDDVEARRQEQMNQLQEARAAQKAQYAENPNGPAYTPPARSNGYPTSTEVSDSATKKTKPTAFDFQDRGKKEREKEQAQKSLQDLRAMQKEKFKDFKSDPNAPLQEAYKAPPSVAGNATTDSSWGGWFGGMFGGGSSSSGSKKTEKPERRGPNIKGVGDLPKPVRRG